MKVIRILLLSACVAAGSGLAENSASTASNVVAFSSGSQEQIRAVCVEGRRHICGRVLQITPAGMVVDSGYTNLFRPPLNHSWVTRGNVMVARTDGLVEAMAPDSVAVGLVLLTDVPRRPKVHLYDYVAVIGYPAGHYDYVPVAGVKKRIRRFACGVERAVTLTMQAGAAPH